MGGVDEELVNLQDEEIVNLRNPSFQNSQICKTPIFNGMVLQILRILGTGEFKGLRSIFVKKSIKSDQKLICEIYILKSLMCNSNIPKVTGREKKKRTVIGVRPF